MVLGDCEAEPLLSNCRFWLFPILNFIQWARKRKRIFCLVVKFTKLSHPLLMLTGDEGGKKCQEGGMNKQVRHHPRGNPSLILSMRSCLFLFYRYNLIGGKHWECNLSE